MKWKTLESKELFSSGLFSMRQDKCELPDGRVMPRYYRMEFPDWVNVFPVTEDGRVLLIKQYRYPTGKLHLELPGGSSEKSDGNDMEGAAARELLEETGYEPSRMVSVGFHHPNPALQSNRMHTFVALGCKKVAETNFDEFEDLEIFERTFPQLMEHIQNGELDHTVMMASVLQSLAAIKKQNLLPGISISGI